MVAVLTAERKVDEDFIRSCY